MMESITIEKLINDFREVVGENNELTRVGNISLDDMCEKIYRLVKKVEYDLDGALGQWNFNGKIKFNTRKMDDKNRLLQSEIHELFHVVSTSIKNIKFGEDESNSKNIKIIKCGLLYVVIVQDSQYDDIMIEDYYNAFQNEGETEGLLGEMNLESVKSSNSYFFNRIVNLFENFLIGKDNILKRYLSEKIPDIELEKMVKAEDSLKDVAASILGFLKRNMYKDILISKYGKELGNKLNDLIVVCNEKNDYLVLFQDKDDLENNSNEIRDIKEQTLQMLFAMCRKVYINKGNDFDLFSDSFDTFRDDIGIIQDIIVNDNKMKKNIFISKICDFYSIEDVNFRLKSIKYQKIQVEGKCIYKTYDDKGGLISYLDEDGEEILFPEKKEIKNITFDDIKKQLSKSLIRKINKQDDDKDKLETLCNNILCTINSLEVPLKKVEMIESLLIVTYGNKNEEVKYYNINSEGELQLIEVRRRKKSIRRFNKRRS